MVGGGRPRGFVREELTSYPCVWPPLPLELNPSRCGQVKTTSTTWRRRRRRFVRDKLLSVNHRALINLGFCGKVGAAQEGPLWRHRVRANWRDVVSRDDDGRSLQHAAFPKQHLLDPRRRSGLCVVRTTFSMIIEVDGCDTGRWKLCADLWRTVKISFDILTTSWAMHANTRRSLTTHLGVFAGPHSRHTIAPISHTRPSPVAM